MKSANKVACKIINIFFVRYRTKEKALYKSDIDGFV